MSEYRFRSDIGDILELGVDLPDQLVAIDRMDAGLVPVVVPDVCEVLRVLCERQYALVEAAERVLAVLAVARVAEADRMEVLRAAEALRAAGARAKGWNES